jgi:hypothetical protein
MQRSREGIAFRLLERLASRDSESTVEIFYLLKPGFKKKPRDLTI